MRNDRDFMEAMIVYTNVNSLDLKDRIVCAMQKEHEKGTKNVGWRKSKLGRRRRKKRIWR
jgi:hypothetical protein